MLRSTSVLATGLVVTASAGAGDLMSCTQEALNKWVGAWRCDTHYIDIEDWRFKTWTADDRLAATESGLTQYLVEGDEETMNFTIAFGEAGIIFQDVTPAGEPTGAPVRQEVTACSGPNEHGFYTVNVQFRPDPEWVARGTLIASEFSTRNAWEASRDGEEWFWSRQEVCVRRDLDDG